MSTVEFTGGSFTINGVDSVSVANTLKASGLANSTIAEIIGGWFVGVTGSGNPTPFQFVTDVEASDGQCTPTYSRSFSHVDWIDGESRVQAGMTPEELGVNARFHAIENEFDAIAVQFSALGTCVTEVRSDLFGIVDELEKKLTTLQNQIHALEQEDKPSRTPGIVGTIKVGEKDAFITQFGDDFKFVEFAAQPFRDLGGLVGSGGIVSPGGTRTFDVENVTVAEVPGYVSGVEDVLTQPDVSELFEGDEPVTVGDLRGMGSAVVLPNGVPFGAVIATMSADLAFDSPADAIGGVTEHLVGLLPESTRTELRESVLDQEARDRTGASLLNSSVKVVGVDGTEAEALASAGLGTVAKLAGASSADVASALSDAGLDVSAARDIVAKANITKALRNRGHS